MTPFTASPDMLPVEAEAQSPESTPHSSVWPIGSLRSTGLAIALLLTGGITIYALKPWQRQPTPEANAVVTSTAPTTVTALGSIEPLGEAIAISAPATAQNSRVEQLLVSRGDRVEAGQILAIMDQYEAAQAALARAAEDVRVAAAQLAQVEAGAKQGEIAAQAAEVARLEADQQARIHAQTATVTRLEAELQHAASEYQRYTALYDDGAISASERDGRKLTFETAQRSLQNARAELTRLQTTRSPQLASARAALDSISEIREVDVQLAQAEVDRARAALRQAETEVEQTYVRSPQAGVVLEVFTRPGERPETHGIVEIGQLDPMMVVAEVYESDIQRVNQGQAAVITSSALDQPLRGTVDNISSKVQAQDIITVDPSATIDNRVIEVDIRLDKASTAIAQSFTNLQVVVEIQQ